MYYRPGTCNRVLLQTWTELPCEMQGILIFIREGRSWHHQLLFMNVPSEHMITEHSEIRNSRHHPQFLHDHARLMEQVSSVSCKEN